MEIHVQHQAINDGTETILNVDMLPVHELPPTRGGVRRMADIHITVPLGSPEHRQLHAAFEYKSHGMPVPIRLRTGEHEGMWNIVRHQMPGMPSDGRVRLRLNFAGTVEMWNQP